jgi:dimethylargininase
MFKHAVVRLPGKNFDQGLTTSNLGPSNYRIMLQQHSEYVKTLVSLGLEVTILDPHMDYPDAYFVEDVAVVTDEIAVITNPGAKERNGEIEFIKETISKYRKLVFINSPGTLDGGDVLQVEKHFFIGISQRTNYSGAEQLSKIISRFEFSVSTIEVGEGLHLKSGVNYIGKNSLLLTEQFARFNQFESYNKIIVDEDEQYAANSLLINNSILVPKGFSKTKSKLERTDTNIIELDVSEVQKMDGGLTCMSLRFS